MKYLITSYKTDVSMELTYNHLGLLESLLISNADIKQVNWMLRHLPPQEESLIAFCKTHKVKLAQVPTDTTFNTFWNTFKYKVGKKKRAEKLWNSMTELEQKLAISIIPSYHRFIAIKNQESAYPETWLHNQMWENQYVIK